MQSWPPESSEPQSQPKQSQQAPTSSQDGFHPQHAHGPLLPDLARSSSASPHSVRDARRDSVDALPGVSPGQLDEKLRRLSIQSGHSDGRRAIAGQRIIDYENAAMTPSAPRRALGFKVVKRLDGSTDGVQLAEFPNEILIHILSHLHPDSHAAVALVSKRFYSLVTTPHAWRMAFLRHFQGHESMAARVAEKDDSGIVRSEVRYFARLTPLSTWRTEYLLRTRLLRGLARGKPSTSGGIGAPTRSSKKASAVLTFNSKLPWAVTNLHAVFANGKRPPRAVHGAADLGVGTVSDPTVGKVEKWGFEDPFSSQQIDEVFPELEPWGIGDGPAAVPNVMDVSTTYGALAGEGFPGGRPYYRPITELRGRYLGSDTGVVDTYSDIPKIPELSEAISCVWLAKSSTVPSITQSMVGILTGSTLGVVTSYAVGWDSSGPRYNTGDMTARWVLSPGVPVVSIKVDDQYSLRRKATRRVWAVALNALGEVFYLTETPKSTLDRAKGEDITKNAWYAGRSAYWHHIEHTRRQARPDDMDKNAVRGTYSPRSPSNSMNLSKEQLAAEAREIEKFLRHKPAHFRKVCDGWDMQRKLEVDFAHDDGSGTGEAIVVIECGWEKGSGPKVSRYTRSAAPVEPSGSVFQQATETTSATAPTSIFGTTNGETTPPKAHGLAITNESTAPSGSSSPHNNVDTLSTWSHDVLGLANHSKAQLTTSALDVSLLATLTFAEDPLKNTTKSGSQTDTPVAPTPIQTTEQEIPGRRARMLAVGTNAGAVLVWNIRDGSTAALKPVRVIQTESPQVSCLALNGLYLVHGGTDGLVQAWDPLASTTDPIRTLNARPSGRVPRHMLTMNPGLRDEHYSAARAIFLDPDPTILRGVMAFGAFLRFWSYSATSQPPGRKRRLRHSDVHGRLSSRRQGGKVSGYIAAETAELRREQELRNREQARLQSRFGVGAFGDMTEEEAIRYAQMMSEEAFQLDEQRRTSASDTGSAADASFDTASSFSESTRSTLTPEPSLSGVAGPAGVQPPPTVEEESDYEMQVQQALRLSLMEGVNGHGQSPRDNSSTEYDVPITFKSKQPGKKNKWSPSASPSASHTPLVGQGASSSSAMTPNTQEEDDLALALKLSMQEQDAAASDNLESRPAAETQEEFPALEVKGKGKGKQKM